MQDVSDLGELPPEKLFAGSDVGSGAQVSRSKPRSKSAQDDSLPESQVMSSYESDPKVDASPTANLTFGTVLESDDDQPATVVADPYLGDEIGTGQSTSIRVRIRPSHQHSPLRESHSAPFRYSAEVLHAMEIGDLLLTVGYYEQAYNLYSLWWETMWSSRNVPAALPDLVSMLAHMSRAVSTEAEHRDVVNKMEQLVKVNDIRPWYVVRSAMILHTHLALLLLRLQQPRDAARHYEHAFWFMNRSTDGGIASCTDLWVHAKLLQKCIARLKAKFYKVLSYEQRKRLELQTLDCVYVSHKPREPLRCLFGWCASTLLLPEVGLNAEFAEVLHAASSQYWNRRMVRRALSLSVFRHLWKLRNLRLYTCLCQGAPVSAWCDDIAEMMQIRSSDIFAAIALTLMNLAALPLPLYRKNERNVNEFVLPFGELINQIHDAALNLVLEETPQMDLIRLFLDASTTLNLTRVPKQTVASNFTDAFMKECLEMSTALPSSGELQCVGNPGWPVAYDPPLNPTPRSSISSGLRSMFSLCRRIISQGAESIRSNENSSDRMSIRSGGSWFRRYQVDLSGISVSTLSSVRSESAQSIAMDWDPAVSDIQEGVAV